MRFHAALACAAGLAWTLTVAATSGPQILVLSNRADLISGGDALVEIKWPAGINPASATVALNNVNVTSAFARRPNGRYMGLVTGLQNGANALTARTSGSGSRITITNHPIGGPVFSGPQLQPWICATQVAQTVTVAGNPGSTPATATATTKVSGLGSDPVDDQCNDLVWHPQRSRARPEALAIHYRAGFVSDGRQLAKVPIIDLRGNQNPAGDIHADWRTYSVRERLDRDAGGHGNQVIWKFNSATGSTAPGAALLRKAFTTMDAWLLAIEVDRSEAPIEVKLRNHRPAAAADFCIATTGANDADLDTTFGIEDPACPVKQQSSPRQVAGGPRGENIYKCQLKPLVFTDRDYGGAQFSGEQKARLAAVFPDGVCNWSVPGVGQVPVNLWTTFAAGPGGKPLGPPPAAVAIR